jgi:hypothetical protein
MLPTNAKARSEFTYFSRVLFFLMRRRVGGGLQEVMLSRIVEKALYAF